MSQVVLLNNPSYDVIKLEQNLQYLSFRKMAIENSMKKKDYANAIRLAAECKEKDTHLPGLVKQWKQYRDKHINCRENLLRLAI